MVEAATEKINGLLESFMGINDAELGNNNKYKFVISDVLQQLYHNVTI